MTDSNKYIGIVKWFHDQTRDANYGFIQHAKLGDIFFHEKSTSGGQNISLFRQDAIVVFNTQESKKYEGKLEAINIRILDTESDVIYLFEQLLIILAEKSEYSYYDLINKSLLNNIKKLLESQVDITKVQELFNLFSTQINKNKGTELLNDLGYLKSLLKVGVQLFPGLYNQIAQQVEEIVSVPIAYKLWVDGLLNKFHYEYVASIMLDEPDPIKQTIYDRCTPNDLEQLFDTFKQHIIEIIKTNITAKEFNEILRVSKVFFTESFKEIQRIVENHISAELAHEFWLKGFLDTCQVEYIATILASEPDQSKEKIFNRCSENDLEQLYAAFKNNLIKVISSNITEKEIENLLRTTRRFFTNNYEQITGIVENNISTEVAHKLWLDSFIETCQINHVANIILHETQSIKERIFDRCSDEDKINIFFRIIFVLEHIDTDFKLATVENSLKLAKEFVPGQYERILIGIINICPDHYKLSLWLNDYHDILDFDAYKILTITLNPNDQKKFVKKVLKKIHEGSLQVEIDAFTSINLIDFETSEKYAQYENAHLDYSTSVVLNVISELHGQKKLSTLKDEELAQHKIYDLVLKQIKDPKDILRITGYFDECEGRCSVSFRKESNEKGEEFITNISYNRNTADKPKNHIICDGRKFVKKDTNEPVLSEEGFEYWWCANKKCFKPSRVLHNSVDWEKYTLLDFLTILKVDYIESDLELYLSIINKANRFFKHMKCRECDFILRPIKQSNYAFYGVNEFHCTNELCSQKGTRIYLTHCLNGKCDHEIDSRDSVKCKPQGQDSDKCGWYVCNYCYSCCSDEGIQRRKKIRTDRGQVYTCHEQGHKNRFICCNLCGNPMESSKTNQNEYEEVLTWFINESEKEKSKYIANSGISRNGKRWFIFSREDLTTEAYRNKLTRLEQIGFEIPNIHRQINKQLVAESNEPNSQLFACKVCEITLDLSSDFEKARIIKSYHNELLKKEVE